MEKPPKKNKINLELKEDVADGVYTNIFLITHSNAEFVLDFASLLPGMPKARVKSRVVLSPQAAKRLLNALNDNIVKFETAHGMIKDSGKNTFPPINFGGPPTQA